jgi:hypothetical protein
MTFMIWKEIKIKMLYLKKYSSNLKLISLRSFYYFPLVGLFMLFFVPTKTKRCVGHD